MKITYFVHGTTIDNEQGLATGWEPGQLSKKGILESKKLNTLVSNRHFDVVFCSDLKRAIDSAYLIFGDKYKIIQDKRLREANYGNLTLQPASIFKDKLSEYIKERFPNGENYEEVENRLRDFLDDIKKEYSHKHIAIVAHQAPQLALDVILKGKTWQQAIATDWRKTKTWQPGWEYELKNI